MERNQIDDTRDPDDSPANALEIDETTAAAAENLMRDFAEEAELETVLLVDRSGALVAGISAEPEVTVELISALVAGASGAMRALVAQLGESGALESLHLGGDRLIYLKEVAGRFVLVAASDASRPPGIVRRGALAIEGALAEIVKDIRLAAAEPGEGVPAVSASRSLRELAKERAARRAADLPSADPDTEAAPPLSETPEEPPVPCDEEPSLEETFETLEFGGDAELEETPGVPSEPKEILEPIDFGEPEIVIESSAAALAIDSPFEAVEDEEDVAPAEEDVAEGDAEPPEDVLETPEAESMFPPEEAEAVEGDGEAEPDETAEPTPFHPEPPSPERIPEVVPPDPVSSFSEVEMPDVQEAEETNDEAFFDAGLPHSLFEFDDEGEDEDESESEGDGQVGPGDEGSILPLEASRLPGPFEIAEDDEEDEDGDAAIFEDDGDGEEDGDGGAGLRSSGPVYF